MCFHFVHFALSGCRWYKASQPSQQKFSVRGQKPSMRDNQWSVVKEHRFLGHSLSNCPLCLSACLTVCLSVWLFVCLSGCLSACLTVWLSVSLVSSFLFFDDASGDDVQVAMPGTVVTMSNEETSALICFVSCRWMGEGGGTVLNFGQALKKVVCSFFCSLFVHFEHALKKLFFYAKCPKKERELGLAPVDCGSSWVNINYYWGTFAECNSLPLFIFGVHEHVFIFSMLTLGKTKRASFADESFLFYSSLCKWWVLWGWDPVNWFRF